MIRYLYFDIVYKYNRIPSIGSTLTSVKCFVRNHIAENHDKNVFPYVSQIAFCSCLYRHLLQSVLPYGLKHIPIVSGLLIAARPIGKGHLKADIECKHLGSHHLCRLDHFVHLLQAHLECAQDLQNRNGFY